MEPVLLSHIENNHNKLKLYILYYIESLFDINLFYKRIKDARIYLNLI